LGTDEARHQLVVDGGENDRVTFDSGDFTYVDTVSHDGTDYDVWNSAGTNGAQLLVEHRVATIPIQYVVVDQDGAFIDANADGVHDAGETTIAVFGPGGNADLTSNQVTIHFNDVPTTPLDVTGFGTNDKIEIDFTAVMANFNANHFVTDQVLGLHSAANHLIKLEVAFSPALHNEKFFAFFDDVNNSGDLGLSSTGGIKQLVYWQNDSANPLNTVSNILPGVSVDTHGAPTAHIQTALQALNQGVGHGVSVDFIWHA
jgi:hypothetical protein